MCIRDRYEAVVNSLDANAKHISIKFEVEIVKKGNKDLQMCIRDRSR